MKKHVLPLLLAVLLFVAVQPAGAEGYRLTADRILTMADHMAKMATGDYLTIKGVPEDLQETARDWARGVTDTPRMIVRTNVEDSALMTGIRGEYLMQPDVVRMEMESTALMEIVSYLAYAAASEADMTGANYERIAEVNSLLHAARQFAQPGATEGYDLYFVLYEEAAPLLIIAYYENDSVSLSGWFLPSRRLANCKNVGQVSLWLMLNGFTMTCEEVPLP